MYLFVYCLNTIIRIVWAWLMFCAFANGSYFVAGLCLICALKNNWFIYSTKYGKRIYMNIDKD